MQKLNQSSLKIDKIQKKKTEFFSILINSENRKHDKPIFENCIKNSLLVSEYN